MITKTELIIFLTTCYEESNNSLPMPDSVTSIIIAATQGRPLPGINLLNQSQEARNLFKTIFQELSITIDKQKGVEAEPAKKIDAIKDIVNKFNVDDLSKLDEFFKNLTTLDIPALTFFERGNIRKICREQNAQQDKRKAIIELFETKVSSLKSPEQLLEIILKRHTNDLAKMSLRLHSKQYQQDIDCGEGPVHIIHCYEQSQKQNCLYTGHPRKSEYLPRIDSSKLVNNRIFDKTNHGIGSGIYGVGKLTTEQIDDLIDIRNSNFTIVKITNPLRLDDNHKIADDDDEQLEAAVLTELSKLLQRVASEVKFQQTSAYHDSGKNLSIDKAIDQIINRENSDGTSYKQQLECMAKKLCTFTTLNNKHSETTLTNILMNSLTKFFTKCEIYDQNKPIVAQPINYVIQELGYNGIVSSYNDSFNRGLIAMKGAELPPLSSSYSVNFKKIPIKDCAKKATQPTQPIKNPLTTDVPLTGIARGDIGGLFRKQRTSNVDTDNNNNQSDNRLDSTGFKK